MAESPNIPDCVREMLKGYRERRAVLVADPDATATYLAGRLNRLLCRGAVGDWLWRHKTLSRHDEIPCLIALFTLPGGQWMPVRLVVTLEYHEWEVYLDQWVTCASMEAALHMAHEG